MDADIAIDSVLDPNNVNKNAFWRRLTNYRDKWDPPSGPTYDWYWMFARNVSRRRGSDRQSGPASRCRGYSANGSDLQAFLGFEQLGEICNVQASTFVGAGYPQSFQGLWQYPFRKNLYGAATVNNCPMLPQQYMRKFMANVNRLTTRSDTFMVTMKIEIVRPILTTSFDPLTNLAGFLGTAPVANLQRIDVLGQKEYMYLVDRSYCTRPPQKLPGYLC